MMRTPLLPIRPFAFALAKVATTGLCLVLAACHTTRFESPPTGTIVNCDPRLVGTWRSGEWVMTGASAPNNRVDTNYNVISPQCRITKADGKSPVRELEGMVPRFVVGKDASFAIAEFNFKPGSDPDDDVVGEDPSESAENRAVLKRWPRRSYMVLKYVVDGDRVSVYQPDHMRIARLIRQQRIRGLVHEEWNGEEPRADATPQDGEDGPQLSNMVLGSSAQIEQLLREDPRLFFSEPSGVMLRHRGKVPAKVLARYASDMDDADEEDFP